MPGRISSALRRHSEWLVEALIRIFQNSSEGAGGCFGFKLTD
jgi:hypothetical protein